MIKEIKYFFEKIGFNVSERISKKIGISSSTVRLYFIYFSFFLVGIPYILYLFMALFLKIKDIFIFKRKSVFDL